VIKVWSHLKNLTKLEILTIFHSEEISEISIMCFPNMRNLCINPFNPIDKNNFFKYLITLQKLKGINIGALIDEFKTFVENLQLPWKYSDDINLFTGKKIKHFH
jgi:hypothetical protein